MLILYYLIHLNNIVSRTEKFKTRLIFLFRWENLSICYLYAIFMKICKHIIGFNGTIVTKLMDFSQIRISLLKNFRLKTQRQWFCCLFLWNSAYSIWTFHCEMRFFCSCAPCLILPKVTVHSSLSICQIFLLFLPFSFSCFGGWKMKEEWQKTQ
jgi:hypothetical protein